MLTIYGRLSQAGQRYINTVSLVLLALQLLLFAGPAGIVRTYAADKAVAAGRQAVKESTAILRVGKHTHFLRLVFETTEGNVQKASVSLSGANAIKVDFQSPISFSVPGRDAPKTLVKMETDDSKSLTYEIDRGLKITANISSCIITIDNLDDINVTKLSSPARLVIDAFMSQGPSGSIKNTEPEVTLTAPDASEIKVESFVIDAGHGGYESGVRFGKSIEKDLALSVSKELAGALAGKGKKVALTRKGDQMVSIRDRARIVNKKSPELLVSIHVSSKKEFVIYTAVKPYVKPAGANGAVFEKSDGRDRSDAIAQAIAWSARNSLKADVKIEKMPLLLLSSIHVPAVLIELPSPDKFSYDTKSRVRMITVILLGIAHASAGGTQA